MGGPGTEQPRPPDDGGLLEVEDLGDTPIRRDLAVPPTVLGPRERGPRRVDPRLIVVAAIVIIVVGLAGTGPTAPLTPTDPAPTGPIAIASPTPTATPDPCPQAGLPAPSVRLRPRNAPGVRTGPFEMAASMTEVGFSAPVDRWLEVFPTGRSSLPRRLEVDTGDARCVDAFDIVLLRTADSGETSVSVTALKVIDGDLLFSAPPSGDWVVRLGLRLRGPTFASAPWAVYMFRLNAGGPWDEPAPQTSAPPDAPPEQPYVVPALPCGEGPADAGPFGIELVLVDGRRVAGVLGDYTWDAYPPRDTGNPPDLATTDPIELTAFEPVAFRIAYDACAVRWTIRAWTDPAAGEAHSFNSTWAEFNDNPLGIQAVAAQNVFDVAATAFGTVIIEARLDFNGPLDAPGEQEYVYWKARLAPMPVPPPLVGTTGDGLTVDMTPVCGVSLYSGYGYVAEECGSPGWPAFADLPLISIAAGEALDLTVTGSMITSWWATAVDAAATALGEGHGGLAGGWSTGLATVTIPAPGPGDWRLLVVLSISLEGYDVSVPYQVRIRITE